MSETDAGATSERRYQHALDRLLGVGLKRTPQRAAVLRALAAEPRHLTPQAAFEQARVWCPEVGLSTVYRTFSVLVEQGIVGVVDSRAGEATYAMLPDGPAHLAVCENCDRALPLAGESLAGLGDQVASAAGVPVTGYRLIARVARFADCAHQ